MLQFFFICMLLTVFWVSTFSIIIILILLYYIIRMKKKEGEVVDMAACQKTFGFLLSSGDWMERRGCKKVGRVQVFLDGLFEGNSWGRTAGGRQVDRKGAGSEACERETDGGEGDCREDCAAELDFCIYAASWKTYVGEGRILHLIGKDCVRDR